MRLHVALLLWATACGSGDDSVGHAVSFETQVAPFIRLSCAGCHGPPAPQGNLALDGNAADLRAALVDVPAERSQLLLVEPYAPSRSFLVEKLTGNFTRDQCVPDGCGATMPLQGSLDAEAQEHLIHWISDGAE